VSWLSIALLAAAVLILIGAEWPRLSSRFGSGARRRRERARQSQTRQNSPRLEHRSPPFLEGEFYFPPGP